MDPFLQDLARPRPDPGGGAAAAYGANLGLALLEKVVRLEGRRRPQPLGEAGFDWDTALARLRRLVETLVRLREEDVRAYVNLSRGPGFRRPGAAGGRGGGSGGLPPAHHAA